MKENKSGQLTHSSVVKTVKQLQQMKYQLFTSSMPLDSSNNIFNTEGPVKPNLTPSVSVKELANRNTSADTDATKGESQSGARRGSNKFQIGAPSNYDKIKSLREQKVKDKNVTKLLQAPDPACTYL